ncbi:unnamed protein product [Sphacelaria rigidula]
MELLSVVVMRCGRSFSVSQRLQRACCRVSRIEPVYGPTGNTPRRFAQIVTVQRMSHYRSTFVSQRSSVPRAHGVEASGRFYFIYVSADGARISGQRDSRLECLFPGMPNFGIRVVIAVPQTASIGARGSCCL